MLFDIHCHILPAIDDGSKSMKETEKMFRMARKERIGTILATPHYSCEREPEFYKRCQNVYEEVCQMIQEKNLGIQLYLGNEILQFRSFRGIEKRRSINIKSYEVCTG